MINQSEENRLSLEEIFDSSNLWQISRRDGKLYCSTNYEYFQEQQEQETFDITQYQQELIKTLQDNIISKYHQQGFSHSANTKLILENTDIYFNQLEQIPIFEQVSQFLSLMTELALGSSEFKLDMNNPCRFKSGYVMKYLLAQSMNVQIHEQQTFESFYEQAIQSQIQAFVVEDLFFDIYPDYYFNSEKMDMNIELDRFQCNNIFLKFNRNNRRHYDSENKFKLHITYPISQITLKMNNISNDREFNLDIQFKDNTIYIPRMVLEFQNCKNLFQNSDNFPFIDLLQLPQISEYIVYFHTSKQTLQALMQIDLECEQIIYFKQIDYYGRNRSRSRGRKSWSYDKRGRSKSKKRSSSKNYTNENENHSNLRDKLKSLFSSYTKRIQSKIEPKTPPSNSMNGNENNDMSTCRNSSQVDSKSRSSSKKSIRNISSESPQKRRSPSKPRNGCEKKIITSEFTHNNRKKYSQSKSRSNSKAKSGSKRGRISSLSKDKKTSNIKKASTSKGRKQSSSKGRKQSINIRRKKSASKGRKSSVSKSKKPAVSKGRKSSVRKSPASRYGQNFRNRKSRSKSRSISRSRIKSKINYGKLEEDFIMLRDLVNSMKLQIIALDLHVLDILTFSPSQTLLDLYEY